MGSNIDFNHPFQKTPEIIGFRVFFVADLHFFVWVKMWVNCLTHTVTHLPKGNNGDKSTGQEDCASWPAFSDLGLHNICSMKAPIVAAASSCFCRVAWV